MNNTVKNTLIAASFAALSACGGSGSKPAPVVEPPVVIVEPAGLTLDETISKMNGSTFDSIPVNGSFGSGSDMSVQDLDFAYTADNGNGVCVNYTHADDSSVNIENYMFNDFGCTKKVTVGGKSDLDTVMSEINSGYLNSIVSKPFVGSYDVYYGSSDVSFSLNVGDILECRDSVSNSSNYISTTSSGGVARLSLAAGVLADENTGVESVAINCDVVGTDGNTKTFENVGIFNVGVSNSPNKTLIDRIASESGNSVVGYDVALSIDGVSVTCDGVLENNYDTRACLKIGSDGSEISNSDIIISESGVDYKISGINYSNSSEVSSDLTSRLGTPVIDKVRVYAYPLFDNKEYVTEKAEFNIKNVENVDAVCEFESYPGIYKNSLTNSTLDSVGNLGFHIEKDYAKTTLNPNFIDDNGNYNLGNIICSFNGLNSGVEYKVNIGQVSGNNNNDHINFPKY